MKPVVTTRPLSRSRIQPQLRLGTRFAVTTLIALLVVQVLSSATFLLLPPPQTTLFGARWLAETAEQAVRTIFAASEEARPALAKSIGQERGLQISWHTLELTSTRPPHAEHVPVLDRLQATLETMLAGQVREVRVHAHGGPPPPFHGGDVRYVPPVLAEQLPTGAITLKEAEIPIPGHFKIGIKGQDGSWLSIEPARPDRFVPFIAPWPLILAGGVAFVTALSVWTAKRSLQPLDLLIEAAQKLGCARETTPIDPTGLKEFAVIADTLNEMQSRIKRFIDERTHMLAAISHDIRTSLTRLLLDAEELHDSENKARMIANMEDMERMISATLTFAGNDLRGERQEAVDLAALLISLCDSLSDRGMSASYTGPNHAATLCQPTAIKRALVNLIDNAIKYGSVAEVQLHRAGDTLTISIGDRGPGIPPNFVELAFQPFRRLESSRNSATGGAGLGLAIARDIIQSHGGDIRMATRLEGGLEVIVRLQAVGDA
jgi:signal transduction histidine kinase